MKRITLPALLVLAVASPAGAEPVKTEKLSLDSEVVADGLENPWGLDFLPSGEVLVTERPGRLRILTKAGLSDPVAGVPEVSARGQGGLLDVAAAPDFATSNTIFMSFSEPGDGGAGTAVLRARLVRDGASARLEDAKVIFSMERKSNTRQHFGSRLVFLPDGTLTFGIGDRGEGSRAQDMNDHAGAVLRINQDGSIPVDNPWATADGHRPELWSKGHRKPQGAAYDPVTKGLMTVEHGAMGGDEVNRPEAGKNYGWPVITYGMNYNGTPMTDKTAAPGMEQPVTYWVPSIAVSSTMFYTGTKFPAWQGNLLVGSLAAQELRRLELTPAGVTQEVLFKNIGRLRDVVVGPDGAIYIAFNQPDRIARIVP